MGATQCVLSRETSFNEIVEIKKRCPDIKLEMFKPNKSFEDTMYFVCGIHLFFNIYLIRQSLKSIKRKQQRNKARASDDVLFDEEELDRVYVYLTTGKLIAKNRGDLFSAFCEKYDVNPALPNFSIDPEITVKDEVPYVLIAKYDLNKLSDRELMKLGERLFDFSTVLINEFKQIDAVSLSKDGKYYMKPFMYREGKDADGCYYVFVQINDGGELLIRNPEAIIKALNEKSSNREYGDDAIEEVYDNEE